jgi:tRNA nucleotidyltransferase (CCA-adding enzyme)
LADKITVFGCIDVWRNPANGVVRAAFEQLTGTLKDKVTKGVELYQQSMREGGTYGAEIGDAGEIKIKLIF